MFGEFDCHLNLFTGMEKKDFEKWSAFYIPGISSKEIYDLTLIKIQSEKDVISIFELSLQNAVKRNVKKAICNLNLASMKSFDTPKSLVSVIQSLKKKYSEKNLELQFYLLLNSEIPQNFEDTSVAATFSLLGSGEFIGICFKGKEFLKNPTKFERYIYSVQRHHQNIKIDFSLFEDLKQIDDSLIQKVLPTSVAGNSLFDADFFLANKEFLLEHKIPVEFTPDNFRLAGTELLNRLKMLKDFGVEVRFGSGNYLFSGVNLTDFEEYFQQTLNNSAKIIG